LFNDTSLQISELEAKLNCPKKLAAFNSNKETDDIDEDQCRLKYLTSRKEVVMTPREVTDPALFAKFIQTDMLMSSSPQNTSKMYDSSIQKSSKHNSTAKKVNITKRKESEEEEDYIGLTGSENFDVMGKKKRAHKEREGIDEYEEEEMSDNEAGSKF
jgi:hypothetical protein